MKKKAPELFIDLHTHSTASDGTLAPAAIIARASRERLGACALTDHDTISGLEEAELAARDTRVTFVRGCELSTRSELGSTHILGLWLPHDPKRLEPLEAALAIERRHREERNQRICQKLQELGMDVRYEEVCAAANGAVPGRPHIAQVLIDKKYAFSNNDAFNMFLAAGKPAYVEREQMEAQEAVALLKGCGALVGLAHPGLLKDPADRNRKASPQDVEALIASLKDAGLDALEAFHSSHDARTEKLLMDLSGKYGLAVTGGSDFHGARKPSVRLGHVATGPAQGHRIGMDVFKRLLDYLDRHGFDPEG